MTHGRLDSKLWFTASNYQLVLFFTNTDEQLVKLKAVVKSQVNLPNRYSQHTEVKDGDGDACADMGQL